MKETLLLALLFFFPLTGICQTGPGGVGTTDGTSNLEIWLRADDLDGDGDLTDNPINGSLVSTWVDNSGTAYNYSQSGTNRPTYNTAGAFNAVNFNASLAAAQFMNGARAGSYRNCSAFFALNPVNLGGSNSLFDNPAASLRVEQWFNTGVVGFTRYGIQDHSTTIASPFNRNTIISFHKANTSSIINVRVDNIGQNLNVVNSAVGIPSNRIGRNSSGADEASGNFYEIILYRSRLNNAQRIIVENYLSAKYGSIAIANNAYNEDNPGAGNYDHDVAGIGRLGVNIHNDSQGTGIVRVLNPSNLDTDEFFMWGHDNGTLDFTITSGVPNGIHARLGRTWRVSEANRNGNIAVDVGSIDMRFDLTGISGVSINYLCLLIDTDNDGNFDDETPIEGATDLGSNIFSFSNVSAISNNRRFTLCMKRRTIITNRKITYRVDRN